MAHTHKSPDCPLFRWNSDRLAPILSRLRYSQGLFAQRCQALDARTQNEAANMVLSHGTGKNMTTVIHEIRQNPEGLLTAARLFTWHKSLGGSGAWGSGCIADDMKIFLAWFNFDALPPSGEARLSQLWQDPIVKAGIALFWFAAINPFNQGSGLLGEAVCELALMRADTGKRWYSVGYAEGGCPAPVEDALRGDLDITPWLETFLLSLESAVDNAEELIAPALKRDKAIVRMRMNPLNERQKAMLSLLLEDEKKKIGSGAYAKAAGCSSDTALRDIQELMAMGLLRKNRAGGRSTTYILKS